MYCGSTLMFGWPFSNAAISASTINGASANCRRRVMSPSGTAVDDGTLRGPGTAAALPGVRASQAVSGSTRAAAQTVAATRRRTRCVLSIIGLLA